MLKQNFELLPKDCVKLYGSPRFFGSYDVPYLLLYACSVTTSRPSALLMTPFSMIAPSILKLIGILSKRSWNQDFFARHMYLQQTSGQTSSPKGSMLLALNSSVTSWVWTIFTHQLEGECWTELSSLSGPLRAHLSSLPYK